MHIQANEDVEAQAKGKALEKRYAELSTLSNGMPVVNMQQLKERFEVPDTADECMSSPSYSRPIFHPSSLSSTITNTPYRCLDTPHREFCADVE